MRALSTLRIGKQQPISSQNVEVKKNIRDQVIEEAKAHKISKEDALGAAKILANNDSKESIISRPSKPEIVKPKKEPTQLEERKAFAPQLVRKNSNAGSKKVYKTFSERAGTDPLNPGKLR